jgi:hypothetical protein
MKITRDKIVGELRNKLMSNDHVVAFWLEGADAHNRVDDYSDLDVWLDVSDGREKMIMNSLRKILQKLAPIDFEMEVKHPHPKIRQAFFHLQGTPEYLIVDVCVQSHSRDFFYTIGHADEKVAMIFEKQPVIKYRSLNQVKHKAFLAKREAELRAGFSFF